MPDAGCPSPLASPMPDQPTAWDSQTLADPHARDDKPQRVRSMFAAIAHAYDLNNHLHSLGIDHLWRRAAVRAAKVKQGEVVADVACGTGDLTQAFAKFSQAQRVIGLDFTPEMLEIARQKKDKAAGCDRIEYRDGDALNLPLEDASVDVVSIAFGIRNVGDTPGALGEFFRVLRPGGRLVVLEFDRPPLAPVRWMNGLYTQRIMPLTATLISGDRSGAYRYLPRSVETYLTSPEMVSQMQAARFEGASARRLTLGIAACCTGVRP